MVVIVRRGRRETLSLDVWQEVKEEDSANEEDEDRRQLRQLLEAQADAHPSSTLRQLAVQVRTDLETGLRQNFDGALETCPIRSPLLYLVDQLIASLPALEA